MSTQNISRRNFLKTSGGVALFIGASGLVQLVSCKRPEEVIADLTQEKFLTDSELQSLVNQLNKNKTSRDALLIFMALYTGARCREVLNIKKKDIVKKLVTIRGIKKSNDRIIPIPDDFYHDLLNYAEQLCKN